MQKHLFDTYAPTMKGVCISYAKDNGEAVEMLQTGFIKIFKK